MAGEWLALSRAERLVAGLAAVWGGLGLAYTEPLVRTSWPLFDVKGILVLPSARRTRRAGVPGGRGMVITWGAKNLTLCTLRQVATLLIPFWTRNLPQIETGLPKTKSRKPGSPTNRSQVSLLVKKLSGQDPSLVRYQVFLAIHARYQSALSSLNFPFLSAPLQSSKACPSKQVSPS